MRLTRLAATSVGATLLVGLLAGPAAAHTTANPRQQPAGGYGVVVMRVPHGCDGQATEVLTVEIPEGVSSVKPEQVPGWTVETEIGTYETPIDNHGEQITEGVKVVTWTAEAGNELPDGYYRDFGLSVKFPEDGPLYFPAVQTCVDGSEAAWIEIPAEGETYDELEAPAPIVELVAGEGGHGASDGDQGGDETEAAMESMDGDGTEEPMVTAAAESSADDGTDPLVIVAITLGALGLLAGAGALVVARRR